VDRVGKPCEQKDSKSSRALNNSSAIGKGLEGTGKNLSEKPFQALTFIKEYGSVFK
jgi:hypothetical protein